MEVQFDYDSDNSVGEKRTVRAIAAANRQLDYAILELDREPGRAPLPICAHAIDFNEGTYLPVNIIQHPAGQPKQIAIRNNLAATLRGSDLAYYTDTNGGSSGSPVCNDQWQVLALHKASTMAMGSFSFQGKETAWINIGTTIDRIIADLQGEHQDLWKVLRTILV